MFKVDEGEKKFGDEKRKIFHSFVMKVVFLNEQGLADVQPDISFLALRLN